MKYYLAGGAIRSLLLGYPPADYDFAFSGSHTEFMALHPSASKLGAGPAYLLGKNEFTPLQEGSIQADLERRDFTINSLLLEENGILHMHSQALADLKNQIIRPASSTALAQDPLRVFRAARFHALYPDFTLAPECLSQMQEAANSNSFCALSAERIGQECLKALQGKKPGNFLRALAAGKSLQYWFSELLTAESIPAGPPEHHHTNVLEHIAEVMDKASLEANNWADRQSNLSQPERQIIISTTIWMALCHDLGKINTPPDILPHHYKHEIRGMDMAKTLAVRLRLPAKLIVAGILSSQLHMKAGQYESLRPGRRVDLLITAWGKNLLVPLFLLAHADSGLSQLLSKAENELATILNIKLPAEFESLGKESGVRLRELRCAALPRYA